jgi:hypothetical protein
VGARTGPTSASARRDRRSVAYEKPPPTAIVSPVIQPEATDARNTATDAMSSGFPKRPSGVRAFLPDSGHAVPGGHNAKTRRGEPAGHVYSS